MRINGTYFERLLHNILIISLPILIFSGFLWGVKGNLIIYYSSFIIIILILWLFDILYIYFNFKPKHIKVLESNLFIDRKTIDVNGIIKIIPFTKLANKYWLDMVYIKTINEEFYFIDKQKFFWKSIKEKSNSLKLLLSVFPELQPKVQDKKVIYSLKELKSD